MSDDAYTQDDAVVVAEVVVPAPAPAPAHVDARTAQLERMREKLSRFGDRAIDILTELAEFAENDRVRLAAAESVLDRIGVGKSQTTQITVSAAEHEIATREAEEMVARLAKNHEPKAVPAPTPSLDVLIVLEGEDATLPTTDAVAGAVEAAGREA